MSGAIQFRWEDVHQPRCLSTLWMFSPTVPTIESAEVCLHNPGQGLGAPDCGVSAWTWAVGQCSGPEQVGGPRTRERAVGRSPCNILPGQRSGLGTPAQPCLTVQVCFPN